MSEKRPTDELENSGDYVSLPDDRINEFSNTYTAQHTSALALQVASEFLNRGGKIKILDVGGGNGSFLDELLVGLPLSQGCLVDENELMLRQNARSDRKKLINADFLAWAKGHHSERFDLISFNFVLHHFISTSRAGSIAMQEAALLAAKSLLSQEGVIVVYEIHYNGIFNSDLPSSLIGWLTRQKLISPLIRRLGANTAGYGVCFHSESFWVEMYKKSGLRIVRCHEVERALFTSFIQKLHKWLLGIESMTYTMHVLSRDN